MSGTWREFSGTVNFTGRGLLFLDPILDTASGNRCEKIEAKDKVAPFLGPYSRRRKTRFLWSNNDTSQPEGIPKPKRLVRGYSQGGPICSTTDLSAITGMRDRTRSTTNGGWKVTSDMTNFTAGGTVSITISGGNGNLKGFTLQALKGSAGSGSFATTTGTKHPTYAGPCKNAAHFLTHSSTGQSSSLTVTWTAPYDASGSVVFSAITYSGNTFYVASPLTLAGDGTSVSASPSPINNAGTQLAVSAVSYLALLLPLAAYFY
eukprot:g13993.t1